VAPSVHLYVDLGTVNDLNGQLRGPRSSTVQAPMTPDPRPFHTHGFNDRIAMPDGSVRRGVGGLLFGRAVPPTWKVLMVNCYVGSPIGVRR